MDCLRSGEAQGSVGLDCHGVTPLLPFGSRIHPTVTAVGPLPGRTVSPQEIRVAETHMATVNSKVKVSLTYVYLSKPSVILFQERKII